MTKKVLVAVANGSEELETVSIVDVLRRGGLDVTLATVEDDTTVKMSQGTKIIADKLLKSIENETFDMIVLPGGMPGAERLAACKQLMDTLRKQKEEGRHIAAICASPAVVLQEQKIYGSDHEIVAYPSFMEKIIKKGSTKVCVSGKLITSVGPGTAVDFALKIIEVLLGAEKEKSVKEGLLWHCNHGQHKI